VSPECDLAGNVARQWHCW